MKRHSILIATVLTAATFFGCSKDEGSPMAPTPEPAPVDNQTVTTVSGSISLPAGMSGTLTNMRVAIYASREDWAADIPVKFVAASGSGPTVSFAITNVAEGVYYLDAWRDTNGNRMWDWGDFVAFYGNGVYPNGTLTPLSIVSGQTMSVSLEATVIGNGGARVGEQRDLRDQMDIR